MSRVCDVTGKKGLVGHQVSHSNRKKLIKQLPNLHKKRFYIPEEDRWVTLRVSCHGLRTITKRGIATVARELGI
ncbi:MAG TPA: 50S ribosomal protein L28 [Fibrobacteraceae bacterium]|nr:50S ribosomal protein L28 [Fibrobacteraceae bacterium]